MVRGLEHIRERRDRESWACSTCRRCGMRRPSSRYTVEEREISPKLKDGVSNSKGGKKITMKIIKYWNWLPREIVKSLFLEAVESVLDEVLSSLV